MPLAVPTDWQSHPRRSSVVTNRTSSSVPMGTRTAPEGCRTEGSRVFHPQLRRTSVLAGPLRWVEADGRHAVLRVDAAAGKARPLCGRTVTLDLDHARVKSAVPGENAALVPGHMVTVHARLPRELDRHALPDVVEARRISTLGPLL